MMEKNTINDWYSRAATLAAEGMYDPKLEHDACGVGFVANLDGRDAAAAIHQKLSLQSRKVA